MKRILSCMMLAFLISVIIMPPAARAYQSGDYTFELSPDTGGCKITSYSGTSTTLTIPDGLAIEGEPVLTVVTEIGQGVFKGRGIESVGLPRGLKVIAPEAFMDNPISSISFPNDLTTIDISAFNHCSLAEVEISDNVTYIGNEAFANQRDADGNRTLTALTFSDDCQLLRIDGAAFADNAITDIKLPSFLESIGERAFAGNGITSIVFKPRLSSIEDYAFADNDIQSLTLSYMLEFLGDFAFANNEDLSEVSITKFVNYIGASAFEGTAVSEFSLPGRENHYDHDAWQDSTEVFYNAGDSALDLTRSYTYVGKGFGYRVTLDNDGITSDSLVYVFYSDPLPRIEAPHRAGYVFHGYFTEHNGNGIQYYDEGMYSVRTWDLLSDAILVAYWTETNYKVDFNSQGGSTLPSQSLGNQIYAQKPVDPVKNGYLFGGWYTDIACSEDNKWNFAVSPVSSDMTLYAKWGDIDISSISINAQELTLTHGETVKLAAEVEPSDATYDDVAWTTSDAAVAAISSDGTVTAIGVGTCIIKAAADSKSTYCNVTVHSKNVSTISLNYGKKSIYTGDVFALSVTVLPSDAINTRVKWSSSDTSVAKVTSAGIVEGVSSGTCTITATVDGKSDNCTVSVSGKPEETPKPLYVDSIKLSINSNTVTMLYVGDTIDLVANIFPPDAINRAVTWLSSDESIASVSSAGHVIAKSVGDVTITATASGHSDNYDLVIRTKHIQQAESSPEKTTAPFVSPIPQIREITTMSFDTSSLPKGTKYILLPCGDTIALIDENPMQISVPCDDIDAGILELVALNADSVPLGSVNISSLHTSQDNSGFSLLALLLFSVSTLLLGVGGAFMFIKIRLRAK